MQNLATKLVLMRDLSPEGRPIAYKGRIREAFGAIGKQLSKIMWINLLCMVFVLPLFVVMFVVMRQYENNTIEQLGYNFSGGLGLGYGVVDDTLAGIETVYGIRKLFVLCSVLPGCMIASLGFAGAYHCCRNVLWGAKVQVLKHFARGIRNHWYKFLITFIVLGALGTGFAYFLIDMLEQYALHSAAGAGAWCGVILCGIGLLLTVMFSIVANPLFVQYKFRYRDAVKNACILSWTNILLTVLMTVLLVGPLALLFVSAMQIVIYLVVLLIGAAVWIVLDLAYGQFLGDTFIGALNEQNLINQRKEQERQTREQNRSVNRTSKKRKKSKR